MLLSSAINQQRKIPKDVFFSSDNDEKGFSHCRKKTTKQKKLNPYQSMKN